MVNTSESTKKQQSTFKASDKFEIKSRTIEVVNAHGKKIIYT